MYVKYFSLFLVTLISIINISNTAPTQKNYDQRQEGELNIQAHLDKILLLIVPSKSFNLLDFVIRGQSDNFEDAAMLFGKNAANDVKSKEIDEKIKKDELLINNDNKVNERIKEDFKESLDDLILTGISDKVEVKVVHDPAGKSGLLQHAITEDINVKQDEKHIKEKRDDDQKRKTEVIEQTQIVQKKVSVKNEGKPPTHYHVHSGKTDRVIQVATSPEEVLKKENTVSKKN